MRRFAGWVALVGVLGWSAGRLAAQLHPDSFPSESNAAPATMTLPAGTRAELALTGPVWARTAKTGDPLYTQVDFPVTAGGRVAIPPGTFVQGRILSVTRPTRRSARAQIQILFNKIIFANGYVIVLPEAPAMPAFAGPEANTPASSAEAPSAVTVNVEVSSINDLLLDNGSQIEMILAAAVSLDARQVARAIAVSKAPEPGKFKSATFCRPSPGSPGTPGTPDTVIPGTPGTPDTTIPGGPGMPDIVIPGTPSTPPTVIPGTPGTPGFEGVACPPRPIVVSSIPFVIKPNQTRAATPAVNP